MFLAILSQHSECKRGIYSSFIRYGCHTRASSDLIHIYSYFKKQNMEQSSISTNVTIDFQKKTVPAKRPARKPRPAWAAVSARTPSTTTSSHMKPTSWAVGKKPIQQNQQVSFNPKPWEIPVKIGFLGWMEQVGENMTFLEYKDDILIIDSGLVFPGGEVYGVDYIIPDISYLAMRKDKIKWIILTHGHLDHIWALKHVLPNLDYPMVYGSNLTIAMVKKSLEEAKLLKDFKYKVINPDMDILKFGGAFTVEAFRVNHNIPESFGYAIQTPKGLVVTCWDYKIDFSPTLDKPADVGKIARIWQEWVRIMLGESTNAMKPWHTISERIIGQNLDSVIKKAEWRLIIATFASNVWRVIQIIESAVKYNKVVFISGRSMINNIDIVKQLGYIKVPHDFVRKVSDEINTFPDERVIVLCTGAQWEEFAALTRISRNEDKNITLKPWDQILMSATPIPGNEKAVFSMMNDFVRQGIEVVTNAELDVHASGHAQQEDIKIMTSLLRPEYVLPIHGEPIQRNANKQIMISMNIEKEKILMVDNGAIVEMYEDGVRISDKPLKLDTVMVDGLGMGHLSGEYVVKARKIMSEDGALALIFKVDTKTKELVGNVQIESRWFVYSSEVQKIHTEVVDFVKKKYYAHLKETTDVKMILKMIKDELGGFIEKNIGRVPMLMPMFVYINTDPGRDTTKEDPISLNDAIVGMTIEEQGEDSGM